MNMSGKISLLISTLLWVVPYITVEGIQSQSSQISELKTQLTGILQELKKVKNDFEEKKNKEPLVNDTKIIESPEINGELVGADTNKATKIITTSELRDLLEGMQKEIPDLKKQLSKARDFKASNNGKIHLEPEILTDEEFSKNENVEPIDDVNATEVIASKEFGDMRNLLEGMQKQIPEIKTQITEFQRVKTNDALSKIDKVLEGLKEPPATKAIITTNRKGFYILPGFASQYGNGMEWKSALGEEYRIDESLGFGLSGRFGHWWKNFFTEFQVNFIKNDVQKIDLGSLPVRSNGEADQLSLSINLGSKINLTDDFFLGLGGGIGLISQDIDLKVSDLKIDEQDTVFSPLLFIDFDYFPNDTFFLNWRYRYSYISKMKNFTSRNLHLLESSFGWIF